MALIAGKSKEQAFKRRSGICGSWTLSVIVRSHCSVVLRVVRLGDPAYFLQAERK